MKKTCYGCKALRNDQYWGRCELGYKIDKINRKPLEDCPKPTTNRAFIECSKSKTIYTKQKEK